MNTKINQRYQEEDHILDFGRIFRTILLQSKFIILLSVLSTGLIVASYIFSTKTYQLNTIIKIDDPSRSIASMSELDFIGSSGNNTTLKNLALLYDTRSNIREVITKLKLNIDLSDDILFSKVSINSDFENKDLYNLTFASNGEGFDLIEQGNTLAAGLEYFKNYDIDGLKFSLNHILPPNESFNLVLRNPDSLISYYQGLVKVVDLGDFSSYLNVSDGLIEASLITSNTDEGIEILKILNEIFLREDLSLQVRKAKSANKFILERIDFISSDLAAKRDMLRDFQEQNATLDIDLEVQNIVKSISEIQSRLDEIEVEKTRFTGVYTSENPLFKNLLMQEETLLSQKKSIEEKVKQLPYSQQNYLDLLRDFESTQKIYNELVSQSLNFSILEASTLSNIRIIDEPFVEKRVSPSLNFHFLAIFASILISVLIGVIRGFYFTPITNPAEINEAIPDQKIIGVLPLFTDDSNRFQNSLESLVMNIESMINKQSGVTILFSSSIAACGKTTTSMNIAKQFMKLGKKVLLIDLDLKKGNLHKEFDLKDRPNASSFIQIDSTNLSRFKIEENLFCIPKVKSLNDSFSFVNSKRFKETIDSFKQEFDYIIFDTAPFLSVADTGILMGLADLNFMITRHNYTKINEIKQFIDISNQVGIDIDGIIYNAYAKPNSHYGYYGLYGNYDYQYYAEKYLSYNYDYDEDK